MFYPCSGVLSGDRNETTESRRLCINNLWGAKYFQMETCLFEYVHILRVSEWQGDKQKQMKKHEISAKKRHSHTSKISIHLKTIMKYQRLLLLRTVEGNRVLFWDVFCYFRLFVRWVPKISFITAQYSFRGEINVAHKALCASCIVLGESLKEPPLFKRGAGEKASRFFFFFFFISLTLSSLDFFSRSPEAGVSF